MNKIEIASYVIFLVHVPLFYFSHNQFYLSFSDFFQLLGFTFFMGAVVISILFFLIKKIKNYNNPIITFIGIFLFFSYGTFYQFLFDSNISVRHIFLIPIFISIFILSIKYIPKPSKKVIMIVFTIFVVLIITDVTSFLSNYESDTTTTSWKDSNELDLMDLSGLPSIIYIIPDEYPSERALKTNFDYDNSQFVHNLTEIGFEINYITSNYMYSDISIPSTLNMNYLEQGSKSFSYNDEISTSKVVQLFKKNNYELILINGGTDVYVENFDENFCKNMNQNKFSYLSEYLGTSILRPIRSIVADAIPNSSINEAENRTCFFEQLNNLKNLEGEKKFVLADLLMPHIPYFYQDEGGNLQKINDMEINKHNFIGNLEIVNDKLLKILPNLIQNNPNTIILVMSDHGFRYNLKNFNQDDLFFDNFFAIYLPEGYSLENPGSTVNVFRGLLQNVNNDIPLIEDLHFAHCDLSAESERIQIDNLDNFSIRCP